MVTKEQLNAINEIDYVVRRNTVRSIVFNDFQKQLNITTTDEIFIKKISNEIKNKIDREYGNKFAKYGWVRQAVIEYIIENNGVEALGIVPISKPTQKTRSVPEILNDLVKQGKISKVWYTE